MKKNKISRYISAFAVSLFASTSAFSEEPIPVITGFEVSSTNVSLSLSNIETGGTYHVQHIPDLLSTNWNTLSSFEGDPALTNWSSSLSGNTTSAFYRVVREPLEQHPKIGQSASFTTLYHGVAGTAHIVDAETLELRNFSFDGQGVDVRVYVSASPTFSNSIVLGPSLIGPAFSNDTLTLSIPEGADLDDFNYVSIWCVPVGIDFGSGQFFP